MLKNLQSFMFEGLELPSSGCEGICIPTLFLRRLMSTREGVFFGLLVLGCII